MSSIIRPSRGICTWRRSRRSPRKGELHPVRRLREVGEDGVGEQKEGLQRGERVGMGRPRHLLRESRLRSLTSRIGLLTLRACLIRQLGSARRQLNSLLSIPKSPRRFLPQSPVHPGKSQCVRNQLNCSLESRIGVFSNPTMIQATMLHPRGLSICHLTHN